MLRDDGTAVVLAVRVIPRSSRAGIGDERDGRLLVRVPSPPLDGRANEDVRRLLAKAAGVPAGRVEVVSGARGRDKLVRIEGISIDDAADRLGGSRS